MGQKQLLQGFFPHQEPQTSDISRLEHLWATSHTPACLLKVTHLPDTLPLGTLLSHILRLHLLTPCPVNTPLKQAISKHQVIPLSSSHLATLWRLVISSNHPQGTHLKDRTHLLATLPKVSTPHRAILLRATLSSLPSRTLLVPTHLRGNTHLRDSTLHSIPLPVTVDYFNFNVFNQYIILHQPITREKITSN